MAEAIKEETDLTAELIEGGGGVFNVTIDDKLVFSKGKEGRFPEHDEILALLR